MDKTKKLDELFVQWEQKLKKSKDIKMYNSVFIKDGIVDCDVFNKQYIKVLFVSNEANVGENFNCKNCDIRNEFDIYKSRQKDEYYISEIQKWQPSRGKMRERVCCLYQVVINDFSNIKQDLFKIGYATFLSDLTNQVLKETSSNEIFDLFINGLIKINDDFDPMIIANIIELKYLNYLGVMPILDCCSVCGSNKKIVTVSSFSGGYLCVNCYKNEYIVDEKTVKLLRMFNYVDISKIKELNILPKNKNEINRFLENYYDRYTGIYLKSKDFLTQLREKY